MTADSKRPEGSLAEQEEAPLVWSARWSLTTRILAVNILAIILFGGGFFLFVAIMGFYGWEVFARLTRGVVIAANTQGYATAVTALGAPARHVYLRHVLPNIVSPITVQATFIFASAMLAEAGLSFLGLGVSPDIPTWGTMISAGRQYIGQADWMTYFPGLAIVLAVLSLQMVGDGLRDLLDPRLRKDL